MIAVDSKKISAKLIGVKLFTKTAIIEMMLTKILDHHAHLTKKKKKRANIPLEILDKSANQISHIEENLTVSKVFYL